MTASLPMSFATVLASLHAHHGEPEAPLTYDPFELVLLENVAYLATPERRRRAFEALRSVGTNAAAILAASDATLAAVTAHGILATTFAGKLRECARILRDEFPAGLDAVLKGPLPEARRALQRFPGIGLPGAERVLLMSGHAALLAPESNGLRVLVRLGLVREHGSYAKTYAASQAVTQTLPAEVAVLRNAHGLLRCHAESLCKRTAPRCGDCPLHSGCEYAVASASRPPDVPPESARRPARRS